VPTSKGKEEGKGGGNGRVQGCGGGGWGREGKGREGREREGSTATSFFTL